MPVPPKTKVNFLKCIEEKMYLFLWFSQKSKIALPINQWKPTYLQHILKISLWVSRYAWEIIISKIPVMQSKRKIKHIGPWEG